MTVFFLCRNRRGFDRDIDKLYLLIAGLVRRALMKNPSVGINGDADAVIRGFQNIDIVLNGDRSAELRVELRYRAPVPCRQKQKVRVRFDLPDIRGEIAVVADQIRDFDAFSVQLDAVGGDIPVSPHVA